MLVYVLSFGYQLNGKGFKMNAKLVKTCEFWVIVIEREDGTRNDYRFGTKREALAWGKRAGVSFA